MRAGGGAAAAAAGLLGAAAAAAAKLALGPGGEAAGGWIKTSLVLIFICCIFLFPSARWRRAWAPSSLYLWMPVLLRVGGVGLVFVCNALMWTVFAKALRLSSSSAAASVTTTASNFIFSAILGKLLFGETWTPLWWVGLTVTLCGLVLLHTAAPWPAQLPAEKKAA